jgi:hypothetical protein
MAKNKKGRKERAMERVTKHEAKTPADQLNVLDQRLGKGKGAKKERAYLASLIKENKTGKKSTKSEKSED